MQQVLEGCDGVRNIHDDIIVHGQSTEEHDKRLEEDMHGENPDQRPILTMNNSREVQIPNV